MNTLPIAINNALTMSSLEIAELTGKNHKEILRDIRALLNELNGEGGERKFARTYLSSQNKGLPCYNLPKRECLILVSGYSAVLRAKIVDRWLELEGKQHEPKTRLEVLQDVVTTMIEQERKLVAVESKADSAHKRLDQIETGLDHFTVIGYARTFLKQSLPLKDAAKFGRAATKFCNDMGIAMGTVPDPRFGNVHTYPKSVLDEVCH